MSLEPMTVEQAIQTIDDLHVFVNNFGLPHDHVYAHRIVDQNIGGAFQILKKSSPKALTQPGLLALARCYLYGWPSLAKNQTKAMKIINPLAESVYAPALFMQAICLQYGWGCRENQATASAALNAAVQKNYPPAVNYLGRLYVQDQGNHERAAKYFNKAARKKYPQAMLNLAQCFASGIGIEKDPGKAAALCAKVICDHIDMVVRDQFAYVVGADPYLENARDVVSEAAALLHNTIKGKDTQQFSFFPNPKNVLP